MVDCPDLTVWAPGQCPAPGLGGEPKLVEGGGEPFNHDTDYNRWLIVLHIQLSVDIQCICMAGMSTSPCPGWLAVLVTGPAPGSWGRLLLASSSSDPRTWGSW